ncbi:MAG: hypothetical protein M1830_008246 [Pleopsidium flavum]|nr:MAG: hypothetical protein M1830_008246 [Pleopsidium flavum]
MSFGRRRNGFSDQSVRSSQSAIPSSNTTSSRRRQSLSVAQTCYLAHTTRKKLSSEASRADHDLRVLVGHANFLDSLMIELAEATQEQNQSIPPLKEVTRIVEEPIRRPIAASTVVEKPADDWEVWESDESDSSESDLGDDKGEEVNTTSAIPLRPGLARSDTFAVESREVDDDDEGEDYGDLGLVRTLSHSPPQLIVGL